MALESSSTVSFYEKMNETLDLRSVAFITVTIFPPLIAGLANLAIKNCSTNVDQYFEFMTVGVFLGLAVFHKPSGRVNDAIYCGVFALLFFITILWIYPPCKRKKVSGKQFVLTASDEDEDILMEDKARHQNTSIEQIGILETDGFKNVHTIEKARKKKLTRGRTFSIISVVLFSFHAFIVGNVLSFTPSKSSSIAILCVVMSIHKLCDGMAVVSLIRPPKIHFALFWILLLIFSMSTPLGFIMGKAIQNYALDHRILIDRIQSGAAGAFFYLVVSVLYDRNKYKNVNYLILLLCFAIGLVAMTLTEWFEDE